MKHLMTGISENIANPLFNSGVLIIILVIIIIIIIFVSLISHIMCHDVSW